MMTDIGSYVMGVGGERMRLEYLCSVMRAIDVICAFMVRLWCGRRGRIRMDVERAFGVETKSLGEEERKEGSKE